MASARVPTRTGEFTLILYASRLDRERHMAWFMAEVEGQENVLVRVHWEPFTGEVMGSTRCDCGHADDRQPWTRRRDVSEQEGRAIGLTEKLKAHNLQDQGLDTVDANLALAHLPDQRQSRSSRPGHGRRSDGRLELPPRSPPSGWLLPLG